MKQRIGDVRSSKDVTATQIGAGDGEQEIGTISESERLQLRQIAGDDNALAQALAIGLGMTAQLHELSKQNATLLAREVLDHVEHIVGVPITVETVQTAVRKVEAREGAPEALRGVVRDLSAALSAISGTLALSQLTDPSAVAVGIPAVLALTGFLAGHRLREIYEWISQRLKGMVG
jgi:hypothetical protein